MSGFAFEPLTTVQIEGWHQQTRANSVARYRTPRPLGGRHIAYSSGFVIGGESGIRPPSRLWRYGGSHRVSEPSFA
jgi:hypothetical protein